MTSLTCRSPQPHAKNNFPHGARWPQSVAIRSTELVGQVRGRNSTKSNHNDGNSGPWLANKIVEKFAKLISGWATDETYRCSLWYVKQHWAWCHMAKTTIDDKKRKINTAHETRVTQAEAHTLCVLLHLSFRVGLWCVCYWCLRAYSICQT